MQWGAALMVTLPLEHHVPQWYYVFFRFAVFTVSSLSAAYGWRNGARGRVLAFVVIATLFNPFIEVGMPKARWQTVDAITGVWLVVAGYLTLVLPAGARYYFRHDKYGRSVTWDG